MVTLCSTEDAEFCQLGFSPLAFVTWGLQFYDLANYPLDEFMLLPKHFIVFRTMLINMAAKSSQYTSHVRITSTD